MSKAWLAFFGTVGLVHETENKDVHDDNQAKFPINH